MIVDIDHFLLLIAKRFGTKTGHAKLCIGLQGFACFSKMRHVSAGMTRYVVDLKGCSRNF
ncbi:hypothetical protein B1L33_10435 [Salmonella enterica]|nr:hypothetical protein [Salmonella enterica]EAY0411034.1 hypothetical protein [Salmonella enterica]EAY0420761.1 hypothetical protein [Salmonella enterica]EBA6750139.1 hypothetical protein [Salmonella enterica]